MPGKFHHEALYRGSGHAEKLASVLVTVCGGGALGSNIAEGLARQGFPRLRVIDRDRVEAHNLSTQAYAEGDVGARKAEVLRNRIFRTVGVEIEAEARELDGRNAGKLLRGSDLVVDTFDNSTSRRLVQETCRETSTTCLHAGLFEDYGEVVWDAQYVVPRDGGADVCDYPLARNLVVLTAAVTCECLVRSITSGERKSWSITLRDLAIRPLEPRA